MAFSLTKVAQFFASIKNGNNVVNVVFVIIDLLLTILAVVVFLNTIK